jgi:hypothetical protein
LADEVHEPRARGRIAQILDAIQRIKDIVLRMKDVDSGATVRRERNRFWVLAGLVAGLALAASVSSVEALDDKPGSLSFGAGVGFLNGTPDGTAFALDGYADVFLAPNFSVGPLLQLGFTGDLFQIGMSGQAKYWILIPNTQNRLKVAVQGGIGLTHASFRQDDTAFLVPLGATADYALTPKVSVTGTFLLNLTDLDPGPTSHHAHVMPGFTVGLRF